jgi:hypothetical protein
MSGEAKHADGKIAYERPQLTTISLRPEEAVLGHCKNAVTTGPGQGTCNAIVPCGSIGS